MFEEVLEFKQAILLCYGWQKTIVLQQKVPKVEVWAIAKNIHIYFEQNCLCNEPIIRAWLLSNSLNTYINLTLILEVEVG